MFTFKPKKVFEKLNKMDRKQAYTIGAIAVVLVVALLMLISAAAGGDDDSFAGMNSHGYDLANMPFATDAAEQYLLANAYPDMQENGSTLLYSAQEKEQRQEEDAQNAEDEAAAEDDYANGGSSSSDEDYSSSSGRGYGGYGGGRGGSGRGRTEIGQLSSAGMATSGGSGVNSTYGPSGDFRQFKGRENRGNERPTQFKTADGRQALAQFRSGSLAAARTNENKMTGARKALMGGMVQGSDAFGKDGVDLSKLQNGGLTLDTSAPATTTDLDNLDKKVADATKKAEDKKNEDKKLGFWEQLGQDLLKQAASSLVDSVMGGISDTIRGGINGNSASRAARREYGASMAGTKWENLTAAQQAELTKNHITQNQWDNASIKKQSKWGSKTAAAWSAGASAKRESMSGGTQIGQTRDEHGCGRKKWTCETKDGVQTCQCK